MTQPINQHDWEPTDNQGYDMQCNSCETTISIYDPERWDAVQDAPCNGKPDAKSLEVERDSILFD